MEREIHAIRRLTTSFGRVLGTMAGVEQFMLAFGQQNLSLCGGLQPKLLALRLSFVDLEPLQRVRRSR